MSIQHVIDRYRDVLGSPGSPMTNAEGTATGSVVTGGSPGSPGSPIKNQGQNKTQENHRPANPHNPQPEPAKARNERQRPHLNPQWVAARDDWHRHYFKCKICQSYHRNQKHRPPQNPCDTGRLLHELYRLASH